MSAAIKLPPREFWTAVEYLEAERAAAERHEFHYGKLITMAGEAKNANEIILNIVEKIRRPIIKQGLKVFVHDVKLEVQRGFIYRYPDLMIAAADDTSDDYLVKKPILLIEVASQQSFYTDSVIKRKEYFNIETLQYYLVISQLEVSIILHVKEDESWKIYLFDDKSAVLNFPLLDVSIEVAAIYDGIALADEAMPPPQ